MICFTERGAWVCRRLFHKLKETGEECEAIIPKRFLREEWKKEGLKEREEESLSQWTGKMFAEKRAMIFVSATGIAVRAIAPWIRDKMTDPPVVTVDEGAQFVIPLLSGHVGGANELARHIADWLEAVPVITTATDVNGKFAVDLFASAYHMTITDRKEAKNISAAVLEGKQVDVKKEKQREIYTSPQVEVVKEIHKMLISDLQKRPTIEELSKKYLINTATLKDTFKGIYGQPIGTYMKEYRIKQAAILLRQTQATIAEIANQVGYENQSKFATAFRDVLKIAPAEYRKQNSGD